MEENEKPAARLGLALSGGGYRAAAFHLGTLRTMNKLNILKKITVLSTVSGGSIVGAAYVLASQTKSYPEFESNFILKLKKGVVKRILTSFTFIVIGICLTLWLGLMVYFQFTSYPWISILMALAFLLLIIFHQFSIFPVSSIIERIYNDIFFEGLTLPELPDEPILAINSTNLETGRQFTFSKYRMADSTYDYSFKGAPIKFTPKGFPISRAVMASSCVPFAFTPIPISAQFFIDVADMKRVKPRLIDGGVFDNQGMHKLTSKTSAYNCNIVITSDAGNKMPFQSSYKNVFTLLVRTVDIFMNRIKKTQMMDNLYNDVITKENEIVFISLGWDLEECIPGFVYNLSNKNIKQSLIEAHQIPMEYLDPHNESAILTYMEERVGYKELLKRKQENSKLEIARKVGTNLTALSDTQIRALVNQSEILAELQIKLYCPSILV
ncbi:hypothetical protein SanaruYs_34900 [Chryseotalea sanaruensis]|uniref:PNPLA domain-containing protein n=1 Tax=Chryseotalea sanaruensis TaxID=2482724 RepID=A0A401UEF4_9BACT|nr:patatin-like phospholipase family protein [Chryseotalea sanaruensis]GCC53247.1 hypothetical protein SanaruYs_34900 [Chryseotalea sanaruensis]